MPEAGGQEPDERILIEAAKKDPRRFAELYENNFDRVYAFIARRVPDRLDAQDLTSEVFHQALANLGRFEWRGAPFAAWLFRIAANAVADQSKRRAQEQLTTDAPEPAGEGPGRPEIEQAEDRARLFWCVRQLPAGQRRVIQMRFAEDKSLREIAQSLGRTEGAVKQLQFRALENLRARLTKADVKAAGKQMGKAGG